MCLHILENFLPTFPQPFVYVCVGGGQNYSWESTMNENDKFDHTANIRKVRIIFVLMDFCLFRNFVSIPSPNLHLLTLPTLPSPISQHTNLKFLKFCNIFRIFSSICYLVVTINK